MLPLILILLSDEVSHADIATWNQTWSGTAASPLNAAAKDANLASAQLARVGLTGGSSSARYNSSGWNTTANYLTITLTPASGYVLNLNSGILVGGWGSSGTGPGSFSVYSSVDSYAVSIGTFNSTSSGQVTNTITLPSSGYNTLSSITFKIVGSSTSAAGGTTASGGTGGPNYLSLSGTVAANAPSAPTVNAATSTNSTGFTASWNTASGATGYYLDVATDSGFNSFVSGDSNLDVGNVTTTNITGLSSGTAYYYRVRAYNAAGPSASSATVTVNTPANGTPPSIITQPASLTNNYSTTAGFTVAAAGNAPFSYQWYKGTIAPANALVDDGTHISGSVSSVLNLTNVTAGDAAIYLLVVTNLYGAVTSTPAILTVNDPYIVAQPANTAAIIGDTTPATLTVAAAGSGNVTYQWQTNGISIQNNGRFSGATSSSLSISSPSPNDTNWNYTVIISGAGTSVTSTVVKLSLVAPSPILIGWDVSSVTGGGTSPFNPTTNNAHLTVGGLTRGSGIALANGVTSRAWGTQGWSNSVNDAATAISSNQFITFTAAANSGYLASFTNISVLDYRRSSTGPTTGLLQYQVGTNAFNNITTVNYGSTASSGASAGPIDLSGIAALQNIHAGMTVTFRIVNYGATASGGTWYIYDVSGSTASDLAINGVVKTNSAPGGTPKSFSTGKNMPASVTLNKLLAGATDADGDALSISAADATSQQGGTIVLTSTNLIYTPAANYTGTDTFACTISDGYGGTTNLPVTVTVIDRSNPISAGNGSNLIIRDLGNGSVRLYITGAANTAYVLQTNGSVSTSGWGVYQSFTLPAIGETNFDDTAAPGARFYRTVLP